MSSALSGGAGPDREPDKALPTELADLSKVTRFEVIDHRRGGEGRVFTAWDSRGEFSLQDGGRTLKLFVTDGVSPRQQEEGS